MVIRSSLSAWGSGWLFEQIPGYDLTLPMADLWLTAPISLIAAHGLFREKRYGMVLGLVASGIYLLGSVIVYLYEFWVLASPSWYMIIPPIFGVAISVGFVTYNLRTTFQA